MTTRDPLQCPYDGKDISLILVYIHQNFSSLPDTAVSSWTDVERKIQIGKSLISKRKGAEISIAGSEVDMQKGKEQKRHGFRTKRKNTKLK